MRVQKYTWRERGGTGERLRACSWKLARTVEAMLEEDVLKPMDWWHGQWKGVRVFGGGCVEACRLMAQAVDLNLGGYDGIALRVRGDGQTYKLNLKTADQEGVPEKTYQATFDTVPGAHLVGPLKFYPFFPLPFLLTQKRYQITSGTNESAHLVGPRKLCPEPPFPFFFSFLLFFFESKTLSG